MSSTASIRSSFDATLALRQDIQSVLGNLGSKIESLKKTYAELLRTHRNASSLFGIDSFYFQNTLLETEHENMTGIFKRIDNRFYCDYYTLHKIIHDYIKNEVKDPDLVKKTSPTKAFPVYKSLEPTRSYPMQHVIDLQAGILSALTELENHLVTRETVLVSDAKQSDLGINIDNLVLSQQYANLLLRERIKMYLSNIERFNCHHMKYFTRLYLKLKLMVGVVNEDISVKTARGVKAKTSINPLKIDDGDTETTLAPGEEEDIKNLISVDDVSPETRKALSSALASIPSDSSTELTEDQTEGSRPGSAIEHYDDIEIQQDAVREKQMRTLEEEAVALSVVESEPPSSQDRVDVPEIAPVEEVAGSSESLPDSSVDMETSGSAGAVEEEVGEVPSSHGSDDAPVENEA
tara:strand:+ start:11618 stop:12838 length:1221 start_codon:yes stop_codon:yes gene_type:complete